MATSPTQRTLKLLRDYGLRADVCEKWVPQARKRKDLFGILDLVAIGVLDRQPVTIGVQATSGSNHSARINKLIEAEASAEWIAAGNRLQVISWTKKKNRWHPRISELVLDGDGKVVTDGV